MFGNRILHNTEIYHLLHFLSGRGNIIPGLENAWPVFPGSRLCAGFLLLVVYFMPIFVIWRAGGIKMKNVNVRKLALAGILVAAGLVCSPLSIPVGASRCAPVQHFINILGGVFLGPVYAVCMAFVTSLLRNLMGTGTLLAFPGSMCGAFLCGVLYKFGKRLPLAYAGELFGTSVIGGFLSYPVAVLLMGSESAVYGFVFPFFVSSFGGTIIAAVLVTAMKKMKVFDIYLGNLQTKPHIAQTEKK